MGSHTWEDRCPHCGFKGMIVSSYNDIYFDAYCMVCGYERWTDEKIPDVEDVELAKRIISRMSDEEIEEMIESYESGDAPLVTRLKNEPPNQGLENGNR